VDISRKMENTIHFVRGEKQAGRLGGSFNFGEELKTRLR
jgi:hypothetical protein